MRPIDQFTQAAAICAGLLLFLTCEDVQAQTKPTRPDSVEVRDTIPYNADKEPDRRIRPDTVPDTPTKPTRPQQERADEVRSQRSADKQDSILRDNVPNTMNPAPPTRGLPPPPTPPEPPPPKRP